ncbi:MAG: TIGR04053 family radical SAM/SPASM domain-containing protein [Acidobacteriota bacterium]
MTQLTPSRPATTASGASPHPRLTDFARSPFIVIWEVTRACALACVHCRADAIPRRDPRELTTREGMALIDQVRTFAEPPPLFVLTGGDPMRRSDLLELVEHAAGAGLTVALTPSGTAAATRSRLADLRGAGLSRLAVSLDGPDAGTHDRFRGVRGSYDWTMKIIEAATELGIPLQINSTVGRLTYPHLPAMAERMRELPIALWAVFFLIATGRGSALEQITAQECESVLHFLRDLAPTVPFAIKTTEAPHYHRVLRQRLQTEAQAPGAHRGTATHDHALMSAPAQARATRSVTDGNGFVFIDHVGQICPSGFLPVVCGTVRQDSLVSIYREHPLFVRLRNPDALEGKCGGCEFRSVCGGSRARAYIATGSPLGADPLCVYEPSGHDWGGTSARA